MNNNDNDNNKQTLEEMKVILKYSTSHWDFIKKIGLNKKANLNN